MVLNEEFSDARYQINDYQPGRIMVNATYFTESIIVCSDQLIINWPPQSLKDLTQAHWQSVLSLKPEIILLGTGKQFIMPSHEILASIYEAQVGIESMETGAACRTYMALVAENRRVVAALLIN